MHRNKKIFCISPATVNKANLNPTNERITASERMLTLTQFPKCHTLISSIVTTENPLFYNDKCGSVVIPHHEYYLMVLYAGFVSALLKMQTGCTPLIKDTEHSVNCSHAQGPENPINQLANCNKLCPDIKL